MGGCEPGQVGNQAAISGYFHVLGSLVKVPFLCLGGCRASFDASRHPPISSHYLFFATVMSDTSEPRTAAPYQVVARRYRPQDFEQLVGQAHVSQALSNAITTGRIGHAYLFTGARGVGKTSSARIFAKSLNCVTGPTPHPCNVCEICEAISTGEDVDVLEIDGASNRGIDEIRQLRQNASIKPSRATYKIYIIDEVHMLTREAFNALLKTLEEPPGHVKFIFCTTEPTKIPITILSRCQRFDFAGIDTPAIAARLAEIAQHEKVTAEEGVFETLARRAAGSMRDAQSLLEQLLSFAPEHIRLADVHEMLGTANDARLFRMLEAIRQADSATIFAELDAAAGEGVDFGILIEQVMGLFRDLMVVAADAPGSLLLHCDPQRFDELRETARQFGLQRILASLQILDQTHNRMRYSTQSRILTELALIRLTHLAQLQQVATLIDQLRGGTFALPVIQAPTLASPQPTRSAAPPVSPPPAAKPQPTPSPSPAATQSTASTSSTPADLSQMDDAKATAIWQQTVDGLNGMLADHARSFVSVTFQPPQTFVVGFRAETSRVFCQRNMTALLAALQLYAGKSVRLVCQLVTASPSQTPQPAKTASPTKRRQDVIRQTAEKPLIRKAEELLGAQLVDVKEEEHSGDNASETGNMESPQ